MANMAKAVKKDLKNADKEELKMVHWTCRRCEDEDPCILSYEYDQDILPVLCPFDNDVPIWEKDIGE